MKELNPYVDTWLHCEKHVKWGRDRGVGEDMSRQVDMVFKATWKVNWSLRVDYQQNLNLDSSHLDHKVVMRVKEYIIRVLWDWSIFSRQKIS